MKSYYESLSEKDRRRYAAIEANKRGYGGLGQIGLLLGCNYRTIRKGIAELKQPNLLNTPSIRRPGGGRKKAIETISVSNGYPAIALNGMWGWGINIKDMFGNVERDDLGKSLKTIHLDLEPFLDGREIVLALDREATPDKVKMVEAAKAAFVRALDGEGIVVTDLKWRNAKGSTKGIDDYIAAKGIKALDRAYAN